MAKKVLGSVRRGEKDGKVSFYIKFDENVSFKKGESVSLFSKQDNLDSLERNKAKLSEEVYQKALERIEKMPEWIKFELLKFE
jgi:hypothetical protein